MMHPETWVDLKISRCLGTLFSNHASARFWCLVRGCPEVDAVLRGEHGEERGLW